MRISNAQITAMMHGSLNNSSEKLGKLMQQMASGQRMLVPSDDPISAVRVLRIQREEASLTQYRTNIANVSGNLSKQEANLKAASDSMLSIRDLLLWAANGNTGEDLSAIANELESLENTVLSFANVRDEEGRYLFSGTRSNQPAIALVGGAYVLQGNDQHRQAAVANGVLVEENVTAAQIFGAGVGVLNGCTVQNTQDPALDSTDPAVRTDHRDHGQLDDTRQAARRGHRSWRSAEHADAAQQQQRGRLAGEPEDRGRAVAAGLRRCQHRPEQLPALAAGHRRRLI